MPLEADVGRAASNAGARRIESLRPLMPAILVARGHGNQTRAASRAIASDSIMMTHQDSRVTFPPPVGIGVIVEAAPVDTEDLAEFLAQIPARLVAALDLADAFLGHLRSFGQVAQRPAAVLPAPADRLATESRLID